MLGRRPSNTLPGALGARPLPSHCTLGLGELTQPQSPASLSGLSAPSAANLALSPEVQAARVCWTPLARRLPAMSRGSLFSQSYLLPYLSPSLAPTQKLGCPPPAHPVYFQLWIYLPAVCPSSPAVPAPPPGAPSSSQLPQAHEMAALTA